MIDVEYNTQRSPLVTPEHGRNIQKMAKQLLDVKDRDERNKRAAELVKILENLNPSYRNVQEYQQKLWDQLFLMTNFELDIDSPFPIPTIETFMEKPDRVPYPKNNHKHRYYGSIIKDMIDEAVQWEDGPKKEGLVLAIANHMKKCYSRWNKEVVEDEVIFEHLDELSDGKLSLGKNPEELISIEAITSGKKTKTTHKKKRKRTNR